ncbi:MBL fold metallo-hydrolase [Psychromonas ossibalaenae]|uniref:MBL fold metallo-hydrolase n=1 Tax=Psychromonas ossibalaenae TaxID=444922 RepID=UPI00036E9DAF|nr:MBL fold metallo-hydrolase [Psychromonas ossibalaenae]
MTTTITVLVDNQAETGLMHEHGLSILIEHQGKRILFDNGQNDALFYNANALGIPLNNLDLIILSHGHYDHGGNLSTLLAANPNAFFYAHPDCLQTRYSLHPDKPPRTISLVKSAVKAIEVFPDSQKKLITKASEISAGIWLTGQIPRLCHIENSGGLFFLDKEKKHSDPLNDDISLWIETENGLTVICGCCHSGIMNTLAHIKKQTEQTAVHNLLGGLHLVNADPRRLSATIDYLNKQNIRNIYPAHCTGDSAISLLKKHVINNIHTAQAGLKITL